MSKSYQWTRVIKKSVVFVIALCIYLGTGFDVASAAITNQELICSSTAYTSGVGSKTASGKLAERNPYGISTVSVDPSVIPFGTYLYIEGYGYAIAADSGSAISGNELDVYFSSSSDCYNWGRRTVKVTILGDSSNL